MLAVQPPYATLILGCDTKDRTLASCVLLWQIAPSCTHCTSVWRGSQRARAAHGLSTPAHSILQPVILLSLISSLHGHLCCSSVTSSCSHRMVHAAMSFVVSSIPEAQRRTVNMQHTMQTTPVPALPALPPAAPLPTWCVHTTFAHRARSGSGAGPARATASASAAAAVCTSAALCAAVTATLPQLARELSTASNLRRPRLPYIA